LRKQTGLFIALVLTLFLGVGPLFGTILLADERPDKPMNLTCIMHNNILLVTWSPEATGTKYELDRRPMRGGTWARQFLGPDTKYEYTDPPFDKELEFRVRAKNGSGWGPWSESIVFRTPPKFKGIYFDFNKDVLTPRSTRVLNRIAKWMAENSNYQILIGGYAEEREGTPKDKIILGERRAKAAREYLADQGVDFNRINIISYGEERPVCTQSNETCWAKNRRAKFVVTNP
jgi:outer membrane protein OmpA-like peptidoglycan-associated protein